MVTLKDVPFALPLLAGGLLLTPGCDGDDEGGNDLEFAVGEWNLTKVAYSYAYDGMSYEYDYDWPMTSTYEGCSSTNQAWLIIEADRTGVLYFEYTDSCQPEYDSIQAEPFSFVDIPGSGFELDFTDPSIPPMECTFDASLIVCDLTYDAATISTWTFSPA